MKSILTLFSRKISLVYVVLLSSASSGTTYLYLHQKQYTDETTSRPANPSSVQCLYSITRMNGYELIKPLMFVDNTCESESMNRIKQEINVMISSYKSAGMLTSASVYLKNFNKNEWMSINETDKYDPGSMLKVPILIAILKMSESSPKLLDKKLTYDREFNTANNPTILGKSIVLGHSYTVRELLTYMIKSSDNSATNLLNTILDQQVYEKLFTDLGIERPDWKKNTYLININDYSKFLRILYNAGYINKVNSEYAIELLTTSDFKNGILKELPKNIQVAHKFGESGNQFEKELHESGIIYLNNLNYLITIGHL